MAKKRRGGSSSERWIEFSEKIRAEVPHLSAWFEKEEDFVELRLKMRDDNTVLAIAKGFGPDGGPVVCFGSGYGVVGAMMAVDSAIQGGRWKYDKPWDKNGK